MALIPINFNKLRNPQLKKWLEEEFHDELFAIADGHDHDGVNSKTLSPSAVVANDSVTTVKILDAAVTAPKIGEAAVTTTKINDLGVTTGKLADDAVETAKIKDLNVTTGKLAATATPNAKAITAAHAAAIPVTGNGDLALTIADAAETNTLAVPTFAGQEICISADTVAGSGSRAVTVASAINAAGEDTITFDAAGEFIILRGIKLGATFAWRVSAIDGATLS